MENKVCATCKAEKEINEFSTNGKLNGRVLYRASCKSCRARNMVYYRQSNPEQVRATLLRYKAKKPAKVKSIPKTNEELKLKQRLRQYKWRKENSERYKAYCRGYKSKQSSDPYFKLVHSTRTALHRILNSMGRTKHQKSEQLLGYTFQNLWDRLGPTINSFIEAGIRFNVDHRIPTSWFIDDTPMSLIHDLRNLQIISEDENLEKQNFFPSILEDGDENYLEEIKPYIKIEFQFC